jgi:hypothetical protein
MGTVDRCNNDTTDCRRIRDMTQLRNPNGVAAMQRNYRKTHSSPDSEINEAPRFQLDAFVVAASHWKWMLGG